MRQCCPNLYIDLTRDDRYPRHLDADEAVVLGASLFAANLSTSFRLRKFGMADAYMYGISLTTNHSVQEGAEEMTSFEVCGPWHSMQLVEAF